MIVCYFNFVKLLRLFDQFLQTDITYLFILDAAFVVLAVYYDTLHATHNTKSVIYKIDFESNSLSLHQELSTDGAWAVEIFETNHHDVYLLLGCFGNSEKSFLYKFDAVTSKVTYDINLFIIVL